MNLPLTQYRNLFGVYLKPQRARVALLVVLLLAVTALQLRIAEHPFSSRRCAQRG